MKNGGDQNSKANELFFLEYFRGDFERVLNYGKI